MVTDTEAYYFGVKLVALALASAFSSAAMIVALRPLLARYALARPNARSSHQQPTPQGGGIAVIATTAMAVITIGCVARPPLPDLTQLIIVLAAIICLAAIGATDDIRPLEARPRLLLQILTVLVVIAALPAELRVLPVLPWWLERILLTAGIVWFVNLVNFMDGIDWMTVVEVVPITVGLALAGLLGVLPNDATVIAVALCGALLGFAPFNRPVAQLFLGDVGSLPIGLLLAWLLVLLAGHGCLAAALLLPLYYLADATITLLRRLIIGEPVMQAHRSHFYQRAISAGLNVYQVIGRVFAVNVLLLGLAMLTILNASPIIQIASVTCGSLTVAALLWSFNANRGKDAPAV